jgi:hypothetical protein
MRLLNDVVKKSLPKTRDQSPKTIFAIRNRLAALLVFITYVN